MIEVKGTLQKISCYLWFQKNQLWYIHISITCIFFICVSCDFIQSVRCEGLHLKTKKRRFWNNFDEISDTHSKVLHAVANRKITMNECFDIESSFKKAQNKAHFPIILDTWQQHHNKWLSFGIEILSTIKHDKFRHKLARTCELNKNCAKNIPRGGKSIEPQDHWSQKMFWVPRKYFESPENI